VQAIANSEIQEERGGGKSGHAETFASTVECWCKARRKGSTTDIPNVLSMSSISTLSSLSFLRIALAMSPNILRRPAMRKRSPPSAVDYFNFLRGVCTELEDRFSGKLYE